MNEKAAHSVAAAIGHPPDAEQAGSGAGVVALVALALIALLGTYVTANAADGGFQLFGACLAGFAILMLFRVIAVLLPPRSSEN